MIFSRKPSDIKLKYNGTTALKLNDNGSLITYTPQGAITEHSPSSHTSDGTVVKSSFKLKDNVLRYLIEDYNGPLVIDPGVEWGTYYGGSGYDIGTSVYADNSNNVYMCGWTQSISGIATSGAYQTNYGGNSPDLGFFGGDAFLAKFSSTGAIQWSTYFGGDSLDGASGVSVDSMGDVFLSGYTYSPSGIATAYAYQTIGDPINGDAFLAKFSNNGSLQWATYYGGSGGDEGFGVATDAIGNVYMEGVTQSNSGIATQGAYQTSLQGTEDVFLVKFSNSGAIQWATYFGGNNWTAGMSLTIDDLGNLLITGYTQSTYGIATIGAYQTSLIDGQDIFLAKFNNGGSIQWATYYGGSIDDYGIDLTTDKAENIFVTGITYSTSDFATVGAYQTVGDSINGDAFLAKFSSIGNIQWATYFGGSGSEFGNGVATDISGNAYITGSTSSTIGIATIGAYDTAFVGTGKAYLAEFNTEGNIQWATYYGGNLDDVSNSIAIDSVGNIYMTGITFSSSGIATPNAYQTVGGESYGGDVFLTKFGNCIPSVVNVLVNGDTIFCFGDSVSLTASGSNYYLWSNGDTTANIIVNESGSYSVMAISPLYCAVQSSVIQVTSIAFPNAVIHIDSSMLITNTPGTYQWYFNDSIISGATQPNYTPTQNGNYYLIVTDNGCSATSDSITITNVGISDISRDQICIQPNPTNGIVIIGGIVPNNINVMNEQGQILKTFQRTNIISLADLAEGLYLIQLFDSDGSTVATAKVIKKY